MSERMVLVEVKDRIFDFHRVEDFNQALLIMMDKLKEEMKEMNSLEELVNIFSFKRDPFEFISTKRDLSIYHSKARGEILVWLNGYKHHYNLVLYVFRD